MKGQLLTIAFDEDRAYLLPDKPLSFGQLGLPEVVEVFHAPAHWTVRVLGYWPEEMRLFVEVLSYQLGEAEYSAAQKMLTTELREIETITFKSIDTEGLLRTLAGTGSLRPMRGTRPELLQEEAPVPDDARAPKKNPVRLRIRESFSVPFKSLRFKFGCVTFEKYFKEIDQTIDLSIFNQDIREEFDAVKNYFANVLKTKKIRVTAILEKIGKEVNLISVKSPEIAKIDATLIDNVKFEFVEATTKKRLAMELDKSLFTMEEYFDTFGGEKSNAFYSNDRELFEDLLQISNTKHYKHLRFLSSRHAYHVMKLRFVHRPFSFIFLIEGERHYHIVWETLDTEEATYVWLVEKNMTILKLTLQKIDDIINVIKVQGKTAYINSSEDSYRRIYHDYSDLVEGFVRWKGELESYLT